MHQSSIEVRHGHGSLKPIMIIIEHKHFGNGTKLQKYEERRGTGA